MTARARFAIPMLIVVASVAAPAQTPLQDREPLTSQDIGRVRGETVIRTDGGGLIGRLEAAVDFSAATRTGTVVLHFAPAREGARLTARAHVSADSPQEGFGAVSALVAAIAGRATRGSSTLQLSQMRVEGDVTAVRTQAGRIEAWWDAQGEMSVDGYLSPVLSLAHLARLQLNVWGTAAAPTEADMHGYATLLFDPANPTVIIGGRLFRRYPNGSFAFQDLPDPFLSGSLTPIVDTPAVNDFLLCIGVTGCSTSAVLLIDVLIDGTVDVRGTADSWIIHPGAFTVEGTGNATFVSPAR